MSVTITPRALDVLRRALEAARLDPRTYGVRVTEARGLAGAELRTGFADAPEPGDDTLEVAGIRVFVDTTLAARDVTLDVSDEHERIVVR